MRKILRGLARFQSDVYPGMRTRFKELASTQSPEVLFITCADSRVLPALITQSEPGELFICRNAGNIVPPYGDALGGVSATIEYAVTALKVRHVILCGHSDCGAMRGVLYPEKVAAMPAVANWLRFAEPARRAALGSGGGASEEQLLRRLIQENVIAQLENLHSHPPVAARLEDGSLQVHGWIYHIQTGAVEEYDKASGEFLLLQGEEQGGAGQE